MYTKQIDPRRKIAKMKLKDSCKVTGTVLSERNITSGCKYKMGGMNKE